MKMQFSVALKRSNKKNTGEEGQRKEKSRKMKEKREGENKIENSTR